MGSNCCRHKDQSPKVSLRKIFSRWTHRISPKSETVKIADAVDEDSRYMLKKRKDSVATDPIFDSPENEDRNHVTMLLPDAPRAPQKKNTRPSNKRVSFQSDVEIMRTASSKSLDRFTVTVVQEEPKARSKSFDSYFDVTGMSPVAEYHKNRRTSSLEHLMVDGVPSPMTLISKLRRDTLGDALDFNAHKRPILMPKPEEPLIEEESDQSSEEEDEDVISSFKLASKLRRDTLGDALLLTKTRRKDESPTGSSTEDLEETVKHSRLCSKLRRDTFGDALRQAVHCKACSSMEDITELEVPLPATPEEDESDFVQQTNQYIEETVPEVIVQPKEERSANKTTSFKSDTSCSICKTCIQLENESRESDACLICSSNENIPDSLPDSTTEKIESSAPPKQQSFENLTYRKLTLTDEEISQALEKIRTSGKIEPKEPYNLVYSSSMKGPFASSKENLNKSDSKSSSVDSLEIKKISKTDILSTPDKNLNHIVT